MPEKLRLIIDIGTNSVLALLAEYDSGKLKIISDKKKTTRLGESLISTGKLSSQAIERTVAAVAEFAECDGAPFVALLGTEALRIASNSSEFANAVKSQTGYDLLILSGEKEAEISFLGTTYNLPKVESEITHIDVGGGSTEITNASNDKIISSISIPIGALKLREMVQPDTIDDFIQNADSIIKKHLPDSPFSGDSQIIATGGTITSVAAIMTGGERYDSGSIHGITLNCHQMREVARRFTETPPAFRPALIPFDPERAELILPGLGIFLALMSIIGKDSLTVSTGGLRYGAALYPDKIST
jgi:exopolyphosphatase / guanosine-5'-triphosphate,3'-diphosphate pyrophosphatase